MRINSGLQAVFIISRFFLFLLVLGFASCNNTKTQYYENGEKKSEFTYVDGEIDGEAKWWHDNGRLFMVSNYENGILQGKSTRWYATGIKQLEETYKDNMLHGTSISYNPKGRQEELKNYVNDTLHGPYKKWHENRVLMVDGNFNKGLYHGRWIYKDEFGNIIGIGEFNMGNGQQKAFYPDGSLKGITPYKDNLIHGKEILYDREGNVIEKVNYEYGEMLIE